MKKTVIFLGAAFFAAALAWGQSITVIAPDGGESWGIGSMQTIRPTGSHRIELKAGELSDRSDAALDHPCSRPPKSMT